MPGEKKSNICKGTLAGTTITNTNKSNAINSFKILKNNLFNCKSNIFIMNHLVD
jgi:hypothetical protein